MDFSENKSPIQVIKEGAFGGTYFKNIYSSVNGQWYRKSQKEFDELKNILTRIIIAQIIMMLVSINKK